ncbi:GerAB/ArcD/ProY family transporter [Paenibacillus sp. strain BS8-2]
MSLNRWEYGDELIGQKELVFVISTIIIGVGVLTLPRTVALTTQSSDGWMSILLAGIAGMLFAWLAARLSTKFHNRTYLEFAAHVGGKPTGVVLAFFYVIYYCSFTAYITRSVAELAKQFLFDQTPLEFISLSFLLVVIFAVSGSRVGLVRLAVIFLPVVVFVTAVFLLLGTNLFQLSKLFPIFSSSWSQILEGSKQSIFSFLGFEIVLFYSGLLRQRSKAPRMAIFAVLIATILYVFVYIFSIGIFSYEVTQNILYPTIEIAREVSVPGEFFERLESLFLIFWLISTFATTSLSLDVSIQSLSHLRAFKKMHMLYLLSPIIFLFSMVPQNIVQLSNLGKLISYLGLLGAIVFPLAVYLLAKIREVRMVD